MNPTPVVASVLVGADSNQVQVAAWGWNEYQQINVPAGLTGVVNVAAGYGHSVR